MNRIQLIFTSLPGKKLLAAASGLILFLFLLGHVTGNLKTFTGVTGEGVPHIDVYAHFLRVAGVPLLPEQVLLWGARVVLLAALVIHVVVVFQLARINRAARPVGYHRAHFEASSLPARTMMVSGLVLLVFVVFHILHFTTGTISIGGFEEGFVYGNLYRSFALWPAALLYIGVMAVLGFHLYHGTWSLFQTLGLDNPDRNRLLRGFALVVTLAVVIGFSLVPLAFLLGLMPEPLDYARELLTGGGH